MLSVEDTTMTMKCRTAIKVLLPSFTTVIKVLLPFFTTVIKVLLPFFTRVMKVLLPFFTRVIKVLLPAHVHVNHYPFSLILNIFDCDTIPFRHLVLFDVCPTGDR